MRLKFRLTRLQKTIRPNLTEKNSLNIQLMKKFKIWQDYKKFLSFRLDSSTLIYNCTTIYKIHTKYDTCTK